MDIKLYGTDRTFPSLFLTNLFIYLYHWSNISRKFYVSYKNISTKRKSAWTMKQKLIPFWDAVWFTKKNQSIHNINHVYSNNLAFSDSYVHFSFIKNSIINNLTHIYAYIINVSFINYLHIFSYDFFLSILILAFHVIIIIIVIFFLP